MWCSTNLTEALEVHTKRNKQAYLVLGSAKLNSFHGVGTELRVASTASEHVASYWSQAKSVGALELLRCVVGFINIHNDSRRCGNLIV